MITEEAAAVDFVNWINSSCSVSTASAEVKTIRYQEFFQGRGGAETVSSDLPACEVSNNKIISDFKCFAKINHGTRNL